MKRSYNYVDITGNKYERLLVLNENGKTKLGVIKWLCRCDCGNEVSVSGTDLKGGRTKSCGCYKKDHAGMGNLKHNQAKKTSEYLAWTHMKTRCYNPNYELYHCYGGRGITVCDRWLNSFQNFFDDMGKKPTPKHSLDRFPDKNGNYEPSNCRWATVKQQSGNRRNNTWIEYKGENMILQNWAVRLKTYPTTIAKLLREGFTFEYVYNKFMNRREYIILDTQTGIFYVGLKEAALAKNINHKTLCNKLLCKRGNDTNLMYV